MESEIAQGLASQLATQVRSIAGRDFLAGFDSKNNVCVWSMDTEHGAADFADRYPVLAAMRKRDRQ